MLSDLQHFCFIIVMIKDIKQIEHSYDSVGIKKNMSSLHYSWYSISCTGHNVVFVICMINCSCVSVEAGFLWFFELRQGNTFKTCNHG